MIFLAISIRIIAEQNDQELIATLRTYGTFYVSEIGNGIWCANLECRPCTLSPIHSTKTDRMAAVRCVEMQLKTVMEVAASIAPF